MRAFLRGAIWALVLPDFVTGTALGAHAAISPKVETVWRGSFRGDSLFVRATWLPTRGPSSCIFNGDTADTLEIRSKYIEYRVEDSRGRARFTDHLSGEFGFCCDRVAAGGTPWQRGLVVQVLAQGWGCEPAGDCMESRYVYLGDSSIVACSDWTPFEWDPASDRPIDIMVSEGCVNYWTPAHARVRGKRIEFEPIIAPGAKEGDLLEIEVDDRTYCPRPDKPQREVTVELFPDARGRIPSRLVVGADNRIDILAAALRIVRDLDGTLTMRIERLGIRVDGRRGYVTPAAMKAMGFVGF